MGHRSEEKLKAARLVLGTAAVHLVRINSGSGDPSSVLGYESLWRPPFPGTLPGGGAGEPPSRPPVPTAVSSFSNLFGSIHDQSFQQHLHVSTCQQATPYAQVMHQVPVQAVSTD